MMSRMERFWRRVTDGMELSQLWNQFRIEARSSYRLYSHDVDSSRTPGTPKGKHFLNVGIQFFWAIIEKLSPARRVLLLMAMLVLVFNGGISWQNRHGELKVFEFDGAMWAALVLMLLVILEVADRVVMKRDLQIAKEIQEWLLPANPPVVPGLEIAFATRAANTVAGDYYDIFQRPSSLPDETFLIAVADVAGKSIPAGLLMATFQASLKTLAGTSASLTELVGRMNAYACSNSQNGRRFTTTFVAEYHSADRNLTFVNAGHNPPILRRITGALERLNDGGIPIGILADAPYQSGTVTLQSGDWLVIFTDGVPEAENAAGEEYGEARLLNILYANSTLTPALLLDTIMRDLDRFVGDAPQHDDVTLVLLKAN
ncbi:MAG: PP2C family protein-serine/threonine phosphatase [Acidobacteriaceae bacterium]